MSLGIPGTSMDASLGGGGSVSCFTVACPPVFLPSLDGGAGDLGSFRGLAAEATCPPRPESTLPAPRAARPATVAPAPSKMKPRRPTAVPRDDPASLDLTTGDDAASGPSAALSGA